MHSLIKSSLNFVSSFLDEKSQVDVKEIDAIFYEEWLSQYHSS